jgi:hypothetical protein
VPSESGSAPLGVLSPFPSCAAEGRAMGTSPEVYRTELGKVWRIIHAVDGGMRVELLKNEEWVPGPIGMVGLRLSRTTMQLTPAAIRALPA